MKNMLFFTFRIAGCASLLCFQAQAFILNGSFEAYMFTPEDGGIVSIPDNGYSSQNNAGIVTEYGDHPSTWNVTSPVIPHWTQVISGQYEGDYQRYFTVSSTLIQNDTHAEYTNTPYGKQFLFRGDIYQTVTGLIPGQEYSLSGSAIINPAQPTLGNAYFTMSVYDDTFTGTLVEEYLSDGQYIPEQAPFATATLDSDVDGVDPAWRTLKLTFTAPASGTVNIRIKKDSNEMSGRVCNLDEITLTTVPEPSSTLLAGALLSGSLLRRRRA